MKRRKTSIFLFITLLFAYLLLFGRAIEPRLSGVPVWSRVVAGQSGGAGIRGTMLSLLPLLIISGM